MTTILVKGNQILKIPKKEFSVSNGKNLWENGTQIIHPPVKLAKSIKLLNEKKNYIILDYRLERS